MFYQADIHGLAYVQTLVWLVAFFVQAWVLYRPDLLTTSWKWYRLHSSPFGNVEVLQRQVKSCLLPA